jgi:hypothetical protein
MLDARKHKNDGASVLALRDGGIMMIVRDGHLPTGPSEQNHDTIGPDGKTGKDE